MAAHVNPASAHAHMLVKALENVILPIVHACVPGLAANRSTVHEYEYRAESGPRLEPVAQQLVSALENFISVLIRPHEVQHGGRTESGKHHDLGSALAVVSGSARQQNLLIQSSSQNQINSEKPAFLKLALNKVRYRVFNKMPIRLLAFKSDGLDMELIERSTILDRISLAMESGFYKADSSLRTHFLEVHDDDTVLSASQNALIDDFISPYAKYAILSHTWLNDAPGEVTYAAWKADEFDRDSAGYQKLANFCRTAATDHGITFGWMDTICINKDSSAELDESIRSMYAWYADASVCIVYLAQTTALPHMHSDPWFTRGWTLQELLAPRFIKFYGTYWQWVSINFDDGRNRYEMKDEITKATGIEPTRRDSFTKCRHDIPISERMAWAANRQVTREEDVAYSLMGIFNVSLSIAYGEGAERAFIRLLKEIMNLPGGSAFDILNWGGDCHAFSILSSCIPSSPKQFLERSTRRIRWPTPRIPLTLTHLGLHVSILLMPAIAAPPHMPLPWSAIGEFYAIANIDVPPGSGGPDPFNLTVQYPRVYNVLDATIRYPRNLGRTIPTFFPIFGLLNFEERDDRIYLPRVDGFALLFNRRGSTLERIPTSAPILFDIKVSNTCFYDVEKSKLGKHGMELRTMYL